MPVTEELWWNLTPTSLAFGKRVGLFIQYPEAVPPVLEVKVVPQAVPVPQGPQADRKWAWSLMRALWKTDIKDLQNVFHMTDR